MPPRLTTTGSNRSVAPSGARNSRPKYSGTFTPPHLTAGSLQYRTPAPAAVPAANERFEVNMRAGCRIETSTSIKRASVSANTLAHASRAAHDEIISSHFAGSSCQTDARPLQSRPSSCRSSIVRNPRMTTFICSSCQRTISGSRLVEREPMCRACRSARAGASRRPPIAAVILAPLCAAIIAAICLLHGVHGPLGPTSGPANLAFWIVAGMAVGLVVRTALTRSAPTREKAAETPSA